MVSSNRNLQVLLRRRSDPSRRHTRLGELNFALMYFQLCSEGNFDQLDMEDGDQVDAFLEQVCHCVPFVTFGSLIYHPVTTGGRVFVADAIMIRT